jgi:phosphoserine phosphatase
MKSFGSNPHREFTDDLWTSLRGMIEVQADRHRDRRIAAFDADGTLWDTDLGEAFFDFQIKNCGLKLPPDPWNHYLQWKEKDPVAAYLWLAQINVGQPIATVEKWAAEAVAARKPLPYFASVRRTIEFLRVLNFEIYVVTASIQWAVAPAVAELGILPERVIGIRTKVKNGIVTDEQDGDITWNEGKPKALLKVTGQKPPIFCAGNTTGDLQLLESSTGACLAITSSNTTGSLRQSEDRLQHHARRVGWLRHQF